MLREKKRNTTHFDFNDENLDNFRFIKVNSMPGVGEHLRAKIFFDHADYHSVHESSLLRLDPYEKLKLVDQDSIIVDSTLISPKTKKEIPTKSYVDSLHESSRNRRDLSSVYNDQGKEFDNNKLTSLDSVTVNGNPRSDKELSIKIYIADELDKNTILRFNQTSENYLKVSCQKWCL